MGDKKLIQVELPNHLVERLDLVADLEYTTRSAIIRSGLLLNVQENEQNDENIPMVAVVKYSNGDISKQTLEQIIGADKAQNVHVLLQQLKRREDVMERQAERFNETGNDEINNPKIESHPDLD